MLFSKVILVALAVHTPSGFISTDLNILPASQSILKVVCHLWDAQGKCIDPSDFQTKVQLVNSMVNIQFENITVQKFGEIGANIPENSFVKANPTDKTWTVNVDQLSKENASLFLQKVSPSLDASQINNLLAQLPPNGTAIDVPHK